MKMIVITFFLLYPNHRYFLIIDVNVIKVKKKINRYKNFHGRFSFLNPFKAFEPKIISPLAKEDIRLSVVGFHVKQLH